MTDTARHTRRATAIIRSGTSAGVRKSRARRVLDRDGGSASVRFGTLQLVSLVRGVL